jgi:type I restriction enzyme R subunit
MLDTGFDAPEVVNLVMARFTKSSILYQQMRGRGTRRADHIFKNSFTIFDFVGVTDFHNDDESGGEGGFVIAKAPADRSKTPRKLLMLDINDHIDPASRDWVTVDEAGNFVRSTEAEERGAKLSVKFEAWLSENTFHSDQMRLLRMIEEQIKADGNEIAEWEEWRFTNPPFSSVGGIQRARQTFGGADGLERMVASLNRTVFDEDDTLDTGKTATAALQREH